MRGKDAHHHEQGNHRQRGRRDGIKGGATQDKGQAFPTVENPKTTGPDDAHGNGDRDPDNDQCDNSAEAKQTSDGRAHFTTPRLTECASDKGL